MTAPRVCWLASLAITSEASMFEASMFEAPMFEVAKEARGVIFRFIL
jgi:hypothetical protein